MLNILLVLLLCVERIKSEIIDLSCTVYEDENYIHSNESVNCENVFSDSACSAVYSGKEILAGSSEERPLACFTTVNPPGKRIMNDVREAAVANCPKRCGYCCKTEAFNCQNSENPRLNCEEVTREMCKNSQWYEVLAEDCPKTCGFCATELCKDEIGNCKAVMCITRGLEDFVEKNCRRTCEFCSLKTTNKQCFDTFTNCEQLERNGFCSSNSYSEAQKRHRCEKTCRLCF